MELWFQGALEVAAAIRRRDISSVECLDLFLERLEQFNSNLNAVVVFDLDNAREAARRADADLKAGREGLPLNGVPMTVKESFDLNGYPSTFGRPDRRDHRANRDALTVERLKAAGAVVFGKTNVPIDLADWQSFNEVYGETVNPWDVNCTPGGSSGGAAAALAAGLTGLELGSDIGGSIRVPAHCCGVYGHKPTYGIVPLRGHSYVQDDAEMDILVGGPLARCAGDLRVSLDIISGVDPEKTGPWRLQLPLEQRKKLSEFRIGVLTNDNVYPVDEDTSRLLAQVADYLMGEGATVIQNPKLPLPSAEMWKLYLTVLRGATSSRLSDAEADEAAQKAYHVNSSDNTYGAIMLRSISQRHQAWLHANDRRSQLRAMWQTFFENIDLLITPIMATAAFPHIRGVAKQDQRLDVDNTLKPISDTYFWIGLASAAYLPATLVPAGIDRSGLPIGMQIIGPEAHDRRCLLLAELLEQGFYRFTPPPGYD
tara:strand:+ start:1653 stop:3104 length:1452 start_codon:yes stop_codon:yes gene_type:complete